MKSLVLAFAISLIGGVALAESTQYGEAGCGLGSMVFGTSPDAASQVMASTTNSSSGSQTFGISTGTSNCVDNGAVKKASAVPAYIEVNTAALATDAARGNGETIAGLAGLMGCEPKALGAAMKSQYNNIFVETKMQPAMIETNINKMIAQNHQACGA